MTASSSTTRILRRRPPADPFLMPTGTGDGFGRWPRADRAAPAIACMCSAIRHSSAGPAPARIRSTAWSSRASGAGSWAAYPAQRPVESLERTAQVELQAGLGPELVEQPVDVADVEVDVLEGADAADVARLARAAIRPARRPPA